MNIKKLTLCAGVMMALMTLFGSCSAPKDVTYMQDFNEVMTVESQQRQMLKIKPDDKLQIVVSSKDPQLASLFNLPVVTTRLGQTSNGSQISTNFGTQSSNSEGMGNYTVNSDGTIDFPVMGTLHVAGMTRSELAGFIKGELMGRNLIKDPTVIVEFLNTGVSVLGEVKTPGRYLMNRDELTVLDAIAMAGDLSIQGRRDNIRVVRKNGNQTQVYIVNLLDGKNLYNNPGFYLEQDDLVYVEPNDHRKRETTVNGNTALSASFWMSVVSVLTSVAVLVVNIAR